MWWQGGPALWQGLGQGRHQLQGAPQRRKGGREVGRQVQHHGHLQGHVPQERRAGARALHQLLGGARQVVHEDLQAPQARYEGHRAGRRQGMVRHREGQVLTEHTAGHWSEDGGKSLSRIRPAAAASNVTKVPKRGRIIFPGIGARSRITLVRATKSGLGLALTGNVKVAQSWRGGVGVGNPGSNVLAVHECHYSCDPQDAEYHNLGKAQVGDRVVKKWRGGKVVGEVVKVIRKVSHRPRSFWSNMYQWGGERLAYFVKCSEPDGHGHYKTHLVVKVKWNEPKTVATT